MLYTWGRGVSKYRCNVKYRALHTRLHGMIDRRYFHSQPSIAMLSICECDSCHNVVIIFLLQSDRTLFALLSTFSSYNLSVLCWRLIVGSVAGFGGRLIPVDCSRVSISMYQDSRSVDSLPCGLINQLIKKANPKVAPRQTKTVCAKPPTVFA